MEELRQLRRQGTSPTEIVEIARDRRLSFTLDAALTRQLRGLGFRRSMIEALEACQPTVDPPLEDERAQDVKPHVPAPAGRRAAASLPRRSCRNRGTR